MTHARDVRDALASLTDDYEVRRELHAVPPHAVFEVSVDGTRAVCKVARGPDADPETEAAVLRHVERETSVPVPRVLAAGPGFFVAEWCDDVPEASGPALSVEKSRAMGAGVAALHAQTGFESHGFFAGDAGPGLEPELSLDARESWPAAVVDHVDDCAAFLRRVGDGESAAVAAEVGGFVRDRPDAFDGAGDPVLCHGNWLPAHVGVDDGSVARVIDFEHALAGPAEYDYWRTVGPAFEGPRPEATFDAAAAREAFRAGYESVRPLADGTDDRAPAFALVNFVSYLRALHVQRGPLDTEEKRECAAGFRGFLRDALDALRSPS